VGVGVSAPTSVGVKVCVSLGVAVGSGVSVGVGVGVNVGVWVGVMVGVGVSVGVPVGVGVLVGSWQFSSSGSSPQPNSELQAAVHGTLTPHVSVWQASEQPSQLSSFSSSQLSG
jgi:hypothetical protein